MNSANTATYSHRKKKKIRGNLPLTVLQKWVGHEELQNVIEEEKGFFNAKCNNILMIIKKLGLFTLITFLTNI